MMDALLMLLQPLALVASLYTCGAAVVRMRYSRRLLCGKWVVMYVAVFALAAFGAATQIAPLPTGLDEFAQAVHALNAATSLAVAFYLRLTAAAWRDGPPPVAQSGFSELR